MGTPGQQGEVSRQPGPPSAWCLIPHQHQGRPSWGRQEATDLTRAQVGAGAQARCPATGIPAGQKQPDRKLKQRGISPAGVGRGQPHPGGWELGLRQHLHLRTSHTTLRRTGWAQGLARCYTQEAAPCSGWHWGQYQAHPEPSPAPPTSRLQTAGRQGPVGRGGTHAEPAGIILQLPATKRCPLQAEAQSARD